MGNYFSIQFPELWSTKYPREKSPHNGIVVALIGYTGSGMSQFIHDATGSYETGVSSESTLECDPYTVIIQDYGFTVPGIDFFDFPITFIDTPGYESYDYMANNNNEHLALQKLLSWLQDFKPRTELDGLIFMHNVSTDEVKSRQFLPDTSVLSKLCGAGWAKKTVLVTTHWDELASGGAHTKQEEILAYWSLMINRNSTTKRYDDRNRTNAWKILQPLVEIAEAAREARLKQEIDDLKGILPPDTLDTVRSVLNRKSGLIRDIITRLGEKVTLTDEEEKEYSCLNEEAQKLWERLEGEINSAELERRLAPKPDLQEKKYIGVVGRTGSGISQFIHDVTGKHQDIVANETNLDRRTKDITPIKFQSTKLGTIILIDTPGFDFSVGRKDEYAVFDRLQKWFQDEYGPHRRLDGVIYMHNIWNTEAYHRSPLLACSALEALCGQDWRRKVILVNSHWSESNKDDGEEKEKELREGYWRFMLSKGSTMKRYESPGNQELAQQILKDLIES